MLKAGPTRCRPAAVQRKCSLAHGAGRGKTLRSAALGVLRPAVGGAVRAPAGTAVRRRPVAAGTAIAQGVVDDRPAEPRPARQAVVAGPVADRNGILVRLDDLVGDAAP